MTRTYVFAPDAELQMLGELIWWSENRPKAPDLLEEEIRSAIDLILAMPDAGAFVKGARFPNLQRVLLAKTRRHLYYFHDLARDQIRIVALWHAESGFTPPL
jgi:plasmid stabilization system protein ParE